jgi:hypothetical protein
MRSLILLLLVFTACIMAWFLGRAAFGGLGNLLVLVTIVVGAFFLLKRRLCLILGVSSLVLGAAGSVLVWTWGSVFVHGDPSFHGMLGTILAVVFVPIGIGLILVGCIKRE